MSQGAADKRPIVEHDSGEALEHLTPAPDSGNDTLTWVVVSLVLLAGVVAVMFILFPEWVSPGAVSVVVQP